MKQLSGLDASFLLLERPNSAGHVGAICMLDPSELSAPLDLGALTELVNERAPLIPLLRQKLRTVPLGLDQPHWVDDDSFDVEYHVREISLPTPGSDAQLAEQISRIHARPLDRSKPLWEIYLVSGLSDGRQAMYMKIHHAAIDGVSGTELMGLLLDLSPEGRDLAPPEPFRPKPAPGTATLLGWAARSLAMRPVSVVRIVAEAARTAPLLGTVVSPLLNRGRDHRDGDVIATRVGRPPRTPFNRPITPHRRYAFRSVNLEEVKQVKNAHGVSVNDVVMAMSAGALRRWLIDHDALPEAPLIAMVPVSVRDEASASALGNKVSAMLAVLPTNLDDPLARLAASHAATVAAKRQHAAIPQGLVDEVTEFLPPALAARAARVVFSMGLPHRISPFNLVISNVPGPNKQVYLKGAKMTAYYPVSVVTDGQGLNITVQGYLGGLHFGLIACRELVPDVDKLTGYLVDELDLLSS